MAETRDALILAVYGGGLTTQAAVARLDGTIVGRGLGAPSDHHTVGFPAACLAIKTAISGAFGLTMTSSLADSKIAAACFALAGVDTPADAALFSKWIRQEGILIPLSILNDAEVILSGGTPDGWGVALISTTGSICVGRTPDGATVRVGGWGHLLGDDGSGYEIAREALKQATRAADRRGGDPALLQAALSHWRLKHAEDLMAFVYRPETSADDIAGFATRVMELATRNVPGARKIVDQAAKDLAGHVDLVIQTLHLDRPPLALGGTMMKIAFKKAILDHLGDRIGMVSLVTDPLVGAIAAARRLLNLPRS